MTDWLLPDEPEICDARLAIPVVLVVPVAIVLLVPVVARIGPGDQDTPTTAIGKGAAVSLTVKDRHFSNER